MFTKLRNTYQNASEWAHHHSAVFVLGLTLCAGLFGSLLGSVQTYASQTPIIDLYEWCDTNDNGGVGQTQCFALAQLYFDTSGDTWRDMDNDEDIDPNEIWFGTQEDICAWYGIQLCQWIDDQIYITEISLNKSNLQGHASFSGFNELQILSILGNQIESIDISTNYALTYLQASRTLIQELNLSANLQMETLRLMDMPSFTGLILSQEDDYPQFQRLSLSNTQLSGVLDLTRLPNLESLHIALNILDGINIQGLNSLKEIVINNNSITGSLDMFCHLAEEEVALEKLEIQNNLFTGDIPECFFDLVFGDGRDYGTINNNFLGIDIDELEERQIDWLDENFPNRNMQYIIADLSIEHSYEQLSGQEFSITISYTNNGLGPWTLPGVLLYHDIVDGLLFDEALETTTINKEFWVPGDVCYDDLINNYGSYWDIFVTLAQEDEITIMELVGELGYEGDEEGIGEWIAEDLIPYFQMAFGGVSVPMVFLIVSEGAVDITTIDGCGTPGDQVYLLSDIGELAPSASGSITFTVTIDPNYDGENIESIVRITSLYSLWIDEEQENNISSIIILWDTSDEPTGIPPSGGNGGGGGGGVTLFTDEQNGICEIRDCSDSYYDGECGICDEEQKHGSAKDKEFLIDNPIEFIQQVGNVIKSMTCEVSQELVQAYVFSYDLGITTVGDICDADMYGPVIRKHLAKFLSMFAVQVLGMTPDTTRVCEFTDMGNESFEMQGFARMACQLGIMGLQQDGTPDTVLNPNQVVNRAMFGTALSRILRGTQYNSTTGLWYQAHLNALQANNIMTNISQPMMEEVRGYVMLMLMRAYQFLQEE